MDDRIVVDRIKAKETTANGLYLPESRRQEHVGRVVAVGPGYRVGSGENQGQYIPLAVKLDDIVFYDPRNIVQYERPNGETLFVMKESNVLGKLSGEDSEDF